jgi:WD40 repeat protein
MQLLAGHSNGIKALTFAGEGRYLVSCAGRERRVSVWRLATGRRSYLSGHTAPVERVAAPPQGDLLATEASDGLYLWSLARGVPKKPTRWDWGGFPTFKADGTVLTVSGTHAENEFPEVQFCSIWPEPLARVQFVRLPRGDVRATSWSRDGRTFALIIYPEEVYRIHLDRDGALTGPITFPGTPQALALSPDGRYLAVANYSHLSLFDTVADPTLEYPVQREVWCWALAYLPDGRLLSCSNDGHTRLWDSASSTVLDERDWQIGPLSALAVDAGGMVAAVGSDHGRILVFDLD